MLHYMSCLRRIQEDLARVLGPQQIAAACREVDLKYRKRILDPITTIHLFVTLSFARQFCRGPVA